MIKIIQALLQYIYGEVLTIQEDFAFDLYKLAKELLIEDLQVQCESFLEVNITLDNYVEFVEKVKERNCEELLELAIDFAVKNFVKIEEKHLKDLSPCVLMKIHLKSKAITKKTFKSYQFQLWLMKKISN